MVPAAADLELSGNVYIAESQTPIENCLIEFTDADLPILQTDEEGYFMLPNIFQHDYEVIFYAEGYDAGQAILSVSEDQTYFQLSLAQLDSGDFESNEIGQYWDFAGNQPWYITTDGYESSYSLRSGNINDQQSSSASFTLNVAQASEISFRKKVSTEIDYDFMSFYINDVLQAQWSGEIDWSQETFPVAAGQNTFRWEYVKDQAVTNGNDCAWIDEIIFPQTSGVNADQNQIEKLVIAELGNYPNPFNPTTTINFSLQSAQEDVQLSIFNTRGQKIKTLLDQPLQRGEHSYVWDGTDSQGQQAASGVYFYQLSGQDFRQARKMLLLK
jgi:hypothetical protein